MSLGSFQPMLQLGNGAKPLETLLLHLRRHKTLYRQHCICRLSAGYLQASVEQQLKGWAFAPERHKKDLRQPPIQEPSGKKVRRRNPSVISTCVAVSQSASATIT
jgi:hypothetical protein